MYTFVSSRSYFGGKEKNEGHSSRCALFQDLHLWQAEVSQEAPGTSMYWKWEGFAQVTYLLTDLLIAL